MARVSYLARREGRYYLQVRCSHVVAGLLNQPLFRTSLRTADYRQARRRVAECLGWVYGMNDSIDFAALLAKNVRQLQTYLSDPLPLSDDRLFARRSYEEMLKNLNRRAQARDFDLNAREPRYRALFEAFVEQNLEAETLSRQREKMAAYEHGRTDIKMGIEFGILITDEAPLAPLQSETSAASRTDTPLSVALEEYLKKRHKERGHDAERGELGLVVQFMVDQLGDPATGAITREQLERIERMLPDIPDRLGLPRAFQASLTARYDYAREHGWKGLKRLTEARIKRAITPGSPNSSVGWSTRDTIWDQSRLYHI